MRLVAFPSALSSDLLARLRAGDQRPLDQLYRDHRDAFLGWARRHHPGLSDDELHDTFQEAVIVLYENVMCGHLAELKVQPHTYLFQIGDNLCKKIERNRMRTINVSTLSGIKGENEPEIPVPMPSSDLLADDPFGVLNEAGLDEGLLELIRSGLRRLTADCRTLLVSFYYHNLSMEEVTEEFDYRDSTVTRVRKSQCLARLRELCRAAS